MKNNNIKEDNKKIFFLALFEAFFLMMICILVSKIKFLEAYHLIFIIIILFISLYQFNKFYFLSKNKEKIYTIMKILFIFLVILCYIMYTIPYIYTGTSGCVINLGGCGIVYGVEAFEVRNFELFLIIIAFFSMPFFIVFSIIQIISNKIDDKINSSVNNNKINNPENNIKVNKCSSGLKKTTLIIFSILIAVILSFVTFYFVSQNLPSTKYADEKIYFNTNGFIFSTISKGEAGIGQAGTTGYYFYNYITKKFKRTLEWEDASSMIYSHYSGKKYNVILKNRKFFIFEYKNKLYSLVNRDIKKTQVEINITGSYKSEYNQDEFYIIDENTYLLYDSNEKITKKLSYKTYDCGNSFYYLDIDSGVIYNKKTNSIYGYKKTKNIPTYFNMSSLNIYEQNKSNIKQNFIPMKTNDYSSIKIIGEDIVLIDYDLEDIKEISISRWDKNYVYLYVYGVNLNIKYNIKTNKYEIKNFYEVLDDETNN